MVLKLDFEYVKNFIDKDLPLLNTNILSYHEDNNYSNPENNIRLSVIIIFFCGEELVNRVKQICEKEISKHFELTKSLYQKLHLVECLHLLLVFLYNQHM